MGITYTWQPGATNFGLAASWTPTGGPPTSADNAEIAVEGANVSGTGVAKTLYFDATGVTISNPLITTVGTDTIIGNTANGAVTVSSTWRNTGFLSLGTVGGTATGSLTITSGGDVTNGGEMAVGQSADSPGTLTIESGGLLSSGGSYTSVGNLTNATGNVTITGSGSTWTLAGAIGIGFEGAGTVAISDGENSRAPVPMNWGRTRVRPARSPSTAPDRIGRVRGSLPTGGAGQGSLTISDSGSVEAEQINVGLDGDSQLTIESGGSLATSGTTNDGFYDQIGGDAGSSGTVTVTGAGSSWISANSINVGNPLLYGGVGIGDLQAENGGFVQSADGISIYAGSTIFVDSTSAIEAGTAGGALAGYLTLDPNANGGGLYGSGTVDANVIDNNGVSAQDGGPLTIAGSVTGNGFINIGEQGDLVLQGLVNTTGGVGFNGWYGTLALGDPGQFEDQIYNFNPGDTIDLTNLSFDPSESSYNYSYGPNGGQLTVTEGGYSDTIDVSSPSSLNGELTLEQDGNGTDPGTDIVYATPAASPFQLWGTPLSNFFSTSAGPVDGDDWAVGSVTDGGNPIWVETETSAPYQSGQAAAYTIVLTSQDWLATEQPLVTVATDTDFVDPFGSSTSIGNLAAATMLNASAGVGAVLYWQASATPNAYALEIQAFTTETNPAAPSAGPNTTLTGPPLTLLPAVQQPLSWTFATNATSSNPASALVVAYATYATATTENIYLQGFNSAGALTGSPTEAAAGVAQGTPFSVSYNSLNGKFSFNYAQDGGTGGTGDYDESFNPATGALGAPSAYLPLPGLTSITLSSSNTLSSGTKLRFVEGFEAGASQQVIQDFLGNGAAGAITTFNLSSTKPDPFAVAAVSDPNDGSNDYTVLAYTDENQVHLELLNENGQQIGSDMIVPGLTSFDEIHTLTGEGYDNATRVEIDYTTTDPNGGTEIEGLIYDTVGQSDYYTLGGGGNGEYVGTPFNDAITDAPGTYTVDGGGGDDTFLVNDPSDQVAISLDASNDAIVQTPTGTATLIGFTTIQLSDATTRFSQTDDAGQIYSLGVGSAVDFLNVPYAAGDTVTITNTENGDFVEVFNSSATQVASFVVYGPYLPQDFSLEAVGPNGWLGVAGVATPISDDGVTRLAEVAGDDYELQTGDGGTGPLLEYQGSPVTAGQFGAGWAPVGAEETGNGYEVVWGDPGANQYAVWNTDANGDYTSSATGVLSGTSPTLQAVEFAFGEGFPGVAGTEELFNEIAFNGVTNLAQVGNLYALIPAGGGPGLLLEYQGGLVTQGQFGAGWAPVGAEKTATGYEVVWGDPGANAYSVWNTDFERRLHEFRHGAFVRNELCARRPRTVLRRGPERRRDDRPDHDEHRRRWPGVPGAGCEPVCAGERERGRRSVSGVPGKPGHRRPVRSRLGAGRGGGDGKRLRGRLGRPRRQPVRGLEHRRQRRLHEFRHRGFVGNKPHPPGR